MSQHAARTCAHEIRPGTVVCLHCRHEAHLAAVARRRRLAARIALPLVGVALLGGGAVTMLDGDASSPSGAAAAGTNEPTVPRVVANAGAAAIPTAAAPAAPAAARLPAAPTAPVASRTRAAAHPIVAEGRTQLRAGVVAVRSGDTVAVHFDTPMTRTRRADKFEQIVRATLPKVYGAVADSVLAAVPEGELTRAGDLLTELPARGLQLRTPDGAALALWPETRPGRDGPLVVTYRATMQQQ